MSEFSSHPSKPDAVTSEVQIEHFHSSSFTYNDLLLLEECPYRQVHEIQKDLPPDTMLLVVSVLRRQVGGIVDDSRYTIAHLAHPPAHHPSKQALIGFLAAEKERLGTTVRYRSKLIVMGSSVLEDQEKVDGALIQQWQKECRFNAWLELCADIPRNQQDDPLFASLGFQRTQQQQSRTKDSLIWRPESKSGQVSST